MTNHDDWEPVIRWKPLASRVLIVAKTRAEGAWKAYIDAVPGIRHRDEVDEVLDYGDEASETIARIMFPEFEDLPYAR